MLAWMFGRRHHSHVFVMFYGRLALHIGHTVHKNYGWYPCVSSEPVCLKMDTIRMKWAQSSVRGLHLYPFTYLTLSTNELSIRSPNWLNNTSLTVAEYLDHCSVASDFSLVLLSVKHFSADLRYKSERSLQAASEETVSPAIRYLLSLIKPSGIQPYLIQRPGCTTQSTPLSDALVCYHWNQHYQIPNVLWKGGGCYLSVRKHTKKPQDRGNYIKLPQRKKQRLLDQTISGAHEQLIPITARKPDCLECH